VGGVFVVVLLELPEITVVVFVVVVLPVLVGGTGIRYCGIIPPMWNPISVSEDGKAPGMFGAENLNFESLTGNSGCSSCDEEAGGGITGS